MATPCSWGPGTSGFGESGFSPPCKFLSSPSCLKITEVLGRENHGRISQKKPESFSFEPCVPGHESFSSGRQYWEAQVGDRTYWEPGVCEENIERMWGNHRVTSEWVLGHGTLCWEVPGPHLPSDCPPPERGPQPGGDVLGL